jgi:hypothetical protein
MTRVHVRLKTAEQLMSPDLRKPDAEKDLAEIRRAMRDGDMPDVDWLSVRGEDILSAQFL